MDQQPPQPPAPMAPQPARLPKDQVVTRTRRLKSGLMAGSVMTFGVLIALVAGHVTGATARQSNASGTNGTNTHATDSSTENPDDGGYFNQGNGGFGISSSAPSQQPIGGSSVS